MANLNDGQVSNLTPGSPLDGTWQSAVGSNLVLKVEDAVLTGTFCSSQDPTKVDVYGVVAGASTNPKFIPVAFSASWPASGTFVPSVTSYTGQYTKNKHGQEKIEVIFLLANQKESTVLWESTHIASDVFVRQE